MARQYLVISENLGMKNKTVVKILMAVGYPRNTARKILSSKPSSCPNAVQGYAACFVASQYIALGLPLSAISGISLHNENGTLSVGVAFD